ncbi:MAG: hypothetical protein M1819_002293 [Sarea resinae]|nr:MAG: hypothetical protein M1819_002293 [Sarea resinae]
MAATLPRPSRPSLNPPSSGLPPLPGPQKRRGPSSPIERPVSRDSSSSLRTPRVSANRTSSASILPTPTPVLPHNDSTSSVPTLAGAATPSHKAVRKTVSIASFPHPPKNASRISSPLAGTPSSRRVSHDNSTATPGGSLRLKRPKTLSGSSSPYSSGVGTPSLLNGSGDARSISSGPGARGSEGLLSLPSPSPSRSSSANGSYSTTATTYDDNGEFSLRGRDGADDSAGDSKHDSKEGKGNVLVSVRVRPEANGADNSKSEGEWMVDGRRSLVSYKGREGGDYYYDNVFATHDDNAKVYDASAKRLVRRVMEGYHGTVFAYGMTGTGKTFSMQGTTTSPGVIPLAITDIFSYIRETPHREFLLRVSYLEIYNEKIHDLLSATGAGGAAGAGAPQQEEIKLREDSKRGVYATPLKEEIVQSPTQLLRVIARGDHQRRTGSTQYNARSSRSHAVVQIVVESRERVPGNGSMHDSKRNAVLPGGVRVSTLSLIDLAGSEKAAESKERRTEGAHINKSLLTLGTVIARLSGDKDKNGNPTDKDGKHLPYRDSKLTRLLQPALSGDSLVSILCTIQTGSGASAAAAATGHAAETLNTLKFAARAKNNIISHAKKAEEAYGSGNGDAGSRVLLERYRMEIQDLRGQLEDQAKAKHEEEEKEREKEAEQRHEEQMLEMQLARTALKERIEHLNRLILCSKSTGVNSSGTFSSLGVHPRLSIMTNGDAKSVRSSSASHSTLEVPAVPRSRADSTESTSTVGQLSNGHSPQFPHSGDIEDTAEDEDSAGEFGDGTATLSNQVSALQADLADKNRYISTLEKRLLQARRASHSRTSMGFSPPHKMMGMLGEDGGITSLLEEKDAEISDLRARLDDKDRMVTALRSAARKRDVADLISDPTDHRKISSHSSNGSGGSAMVNGGPVGPLTPTSPVGLLPAETRKSKSVDEMSRILDEMIQDRVESGHLVKGSRGSFRVAEKKRESILGASGTPGGGSGVLTGVHHPIVSGVLGASPGAPPGTPLPALEAFKGPGPVLEEEPAQ